MSSTASPSPRLLRSSSMRASCSAHRHVGEEHRRRRQPHRPVGLDNRGRRGTDVGLRQIQRERAALSGRAAQLNFAAEQVGQLAADGQAQAGSAVLAAGAGVGLLEGLEDDALFFGRNADAGIGNFERDHRAGAGEDRDDRRSSRP